MKELPTPTCCARVMEKRFSGEPVVFFWVSPEDDTDRGWQIHGLSGYVNFCPYCGAALPLMTKTRTLAKVAVVTDGGYYCDTCRERLNACTCSYPAAQWTGPLTIFSPVA